MTATDSVKKKLSLSLSLVLALSAVAPAICAQEVTGVAQTLFDEGKRLMKEEKYDQACPKLSESYKLQPFTGTLLNLATCNERWGKTATAWAQFRDALAASKKDGNADREAYAREHIKELEPHLSHLTISADKKVDRNGLSISLDDVSLGTAILGAMIPVDPGKHVIHVTQAGKKPWSTEIEIGKENDSKSVQIPQLQKEPEKPKEIVPVGPTLPPPPPRNNTAGWIVGSTGVALLGVAVFTGIEASSKWNTRNDNCQNDQCNPLGLQADKSARNWAFATDIFIATGVIATGVGAYLILRPSPSAEARPAPRVGSSPPSGSTYVAPSFGPGYGGFAVTGSF
jgi:hypothetical protein